MLELLITVIILGIIFWFVETYVPMSDPFKSLFRVVAVIIVLVLLLNFLGVGGLGRFSIR